MNPSILRDLRGFGACGLLAVAVILAGLLIGPPVAAVLILVWARLSRTSLTALGFLHPRSWGLSLAGGAALGAMTKIVLKAIVMPLLGAPAVNARYHYLAGNTAALPGIVLVVLISAAFGEEVFFRGYLFERFGQLFGESSASRAGAVALSAALFALAHYPDQGVPGVQQAAVTGLLFGCVFAWRRNIWLVMTAHAAFDLVAIALIYWSVEDAVAHALFH